MALVYEGENEVKRSMMAISDKIKQCLLVIIHEVKIWHLRIFERINR